MNTSSSSLTIRISLSRWHRVCQRLKDHIDEAAEIALSFLAKQTARDFLGEFQIAVLEERMAEGREALKRHARLLEARSTIRAAIGRRNHEVGIGEIVSELEIIEVRLACLEDLYREQHPHQVPVEEIERFFSRIAAEGRQDVETFYSAANRYATLGTPTKGVSVQLLTQAEKERVEGEIKRLKAHKLQLQDKLPDLNKRPLELPIPQEVGRLVLGEEPDGNCGQTT